MSTVLNYRAAIETFNLSKRFGSTLAVDNLSLTLPEGEMFALVGPDGAGKTTTLRLLCGILEPTSGKARILGRDLKGESAWIKAHIGYLSQGFSLYGYLSVDENIEFFAEIHGIREYKERRDKLLDFMRLSPFRKRLASRLSGGMQKKLALACTLIHQPRIILLDEPTTGVDPASRRDFWIILSSLLKSGLTIILTTPYMDEAERSTRVGLLSGGRLLKVDSPERIKSQFQRQTLEIVCSDRSRAFSLLKGALELNPEDVQIFGDRLNVLTGCKENETAWVKNFLLKEGIEIEEARVVPPSLENVFISLMREERRSQ